MLSDLMTLRHDLAGEFWVPSTFANRRDSRIVVSIYTERFAHTVEISIRCWSRDPETVDEAKGFRTLYETGVHRAVGIEHHFVACCIGPQKRNHRIGHRKFHVLAAHPPLTSEECCGNGLHCIHRSDLVGSSLAEEHGRAIFGIGLVRSETGIRLDHGVVGTSLCIGTGLTKARQRDVDEVVTPLR